jgi:hypothetical protein
VRQVANDSSGGFGWGLVVGGVIGFVAGAYLASGPGRGQIDSVRSRTIELSSGAAQRARGAVNPEHPIGRAIQEGITAARRRRVELETEGRMAGPTPAPTPTPAPNVRTARTARTMEPAEET